MDDRLIMGAVIVVLVILGLLFLTACDVHQNDLDIGLDVQCDGKCRVVFEGKEAERSKKRDASGIPIIP